MRFLKTWISEKKIFWQILANLILANGTLEKEFPCLIRILSELLEITLSLFVSGVERLKLDFALFAKGKNSYDTVGWDLSIIFDSKRA